MKTSSAADGVVVVSFAQVAIDFVHDRVEDRCSFAAAAAAAAFDGSQW